MKALKKQFPTDMDSTKLIMGTTEGIYLKAVNVSQIETGPEYNTNADPNQNTIVMVLTNRYGEPLHFDPTTYEQVLTGGRIAYYFMRSSEGIIKADDSINETYVGKLADSLSTIRRISFSRQNAATLAT